MSEWQKHINRKFADKNTYTLSTVESGKDLIITVGSAQGKVKTSLSIIIDISNDIIYEIQFYSGQSNSYVAEYFNYHYSDENIKEIDQFLQIPLNKGWKEIHYFNSKGTKLKTVFHYDGRKHTHHFKIFKGIGKKSTKEENIVPILNIK